jgi:hypothetical protein
VVCRKIYIDTCKKGKAVKVQALSVMVHGHIYYLPVTPNLTFNSTVDVAENLKGSHEPRPSVISPKCGMPTASGLAVQQLQPKSKSPGSSSEGSGKVSSIPRVDPRALDNIPEDGISATAMEPNVQLLQPAGKLKKPGSDSSCEAAVLVVENAAATSSSSSSGGGKPSAAMSKPYVMLKCFTMLAQQSANSCILPVAQLLEHLSQKRCLLSMEQLIELVLEQ